MSSQIVALENAPDANNNYWCKTEPNLQRAWSASSLGVLMKCPFEYYLTYVVGLRGDDTPAQHFGKLYHAALEKYDEALALGGSPDEAVDAAIVRAHELCWGSEYVASENELGVPLMKPRHEPEWQPEDNKRDPLTLLRSIVWYAEQYYNDPTKTLLINNSPAVEISFKIALPLTNPDGDEYLLTGFLDGAVEYADVTKLIRERKTTATTVSGRYFDRYKIDNQMLMYTAAGEVVLGEEFEGILLDVCQTAVHFSEFARHEERRTDEQIEEWLSLVMEWILQNERWAEKNYWPRNYASCNNYGGCTFRDYCSKSPSVREHFLPMDMKIKRRVEIDKRGD